MFLREIPTVSETEVEVRFRERDSEVDNIVRAISSSGDVIYGIDDKGDTEMIYISQILYIEAVDKDVFAYRAEGVSICKNIRSMEQTDVLG